MRTVALAFVACSLVLAAAAPARADDAALPRASIRTFPTVPIEGEPVDFIAFSPGVGVTYSWDLNGDGAFGDASGAMVRRTLPVGTRTVSVRATDTSGRTSTETRSVTVATANYAPDIGIDVNQRVEVDRSEQVRVEAWDVEGRIVRLEMDRDGDGTYEVSEPGENYWRNSWVLYSHVTFDTPGDRIVRVRATDDQGATAVATATVHVVDSPPYAWLSVYGESFDQPPVAGQPATISADSTRPGVKYEFDLDGDGDYELDKGATREFEAPLSAGAHVIGARITDTRGTVLEPRITTFVYQPEDSFADKFFVRRFESRATVGEPLDLAVNVEPYSYVYTVEWDADGDGAFDDGTFTTPGGEDPGSSIGHNTYTYSAPGVYEQRVRVSRQGLPTRIFSARIFVDTRTPDHTPSASIGRGFGTPFGEPVRIEAGITGDALVNATLSWDLDGDGEFDDVPAYRDWAYWWTFTAPTTIAIKATDVTGATSVVTKQVQPRGIDRAPAASLDVSGVAGGPLLASYSVDDPAGARCCDAEWDSDGDGAYDDGHGAFPAVTATAGEHTVGVRLTNSEGRSAFVRKTFTVTTGPPPVVPVGPGANPPAAGPATIATLPRRLQLRAKAPKRTFRAVIVRTFCSAKCRTTVVVRLGKRVLGKATGRGGKVKVTLSRKARRLIARSPGRRLTITISAPGAKRVKKTLKIRR